MPQRRVSQWLSRSGEEIALPLSAQALPSINEGQEIGYFVKIEHANHTFASTSAGTAASAGQNDGGNIPQPAQQEPSLAQATQDQRESTQHEEGEVWEEEDL
jgi:hypothetical protein